MSHSINALQALALYDGKLNAVGGAAGFGSYSIRDTLYSTGTSSINIPTGNNGALSLSYGGTTTFWVINGTLTVNAQIQDNVGPNPGALNVIGAGLLVLNDSSTYTGGTTLGGGTLRANAPAATGTGPVTINAGGALGGNGSVGAVSVAGTITAGPDTSTVGKLATGPQTWVTGGTFLAKFAADNASNDQLVMSGLTVSGSTFTVNVTGAAVGTAAATGRYVLAIDTGASFATTPDPFAVASLSLQVNGLAAPAGDVLAEQADTTGQGGVDLVFVAAAPEPTGLLLASVAIVPLALGRRRRRRAV